METCETLYKDIKPEIETYVADTPASELNLSYANIRFGDIQITQLTLGSEQIRVRDLSDKDDYYYLEGILNVYPTLKLLPIMFYELSDFYNVYYFQGFLGLINNITLFDSDELAFGNGWKFKLSCLETLEPSGHFDIFVNRFLPFLIKDNRFSEEEKANVEKFIYKYV